MKVTQTELKCVTISNNMLKLTNHHVKFKKSKQFYHFEK